MKRIIKTLWLSPAEHFAAQLIRYGIVAGCGYLLAIVVYSGELAIGIRAYPALGIAFVLNGIFNFTLIRLWAFPRSGRQVRSDFNRFCLVAAGSFVVNYASFAVLYSGIGISAVTAQRLAILIAAPITFLANRFWSFRASRSDCQSEIDCDASATSAKKESYSRM
ncbi:MAG: GtrA family protein [Solirubrobacteraceae bacterium]